MEKVRHLGTELACAFWCSALQQRYRNAPAQVLLRLVRQWNMPSCIAASMSSQFISILLEISWILYCAQLHLIRTSNELLKHYLNTVGMQDPAMITLSSLPAQFRPTQQSSGTSGTKALRNLMKSLDVIGMICYLQCAIRSRGTVPDFVEVSSTTPFLEAVSKTPWICLDVSWWIHDVPGCNIITFDIIWCTFNSTFWFVQV